MGDPDGMIKKLNEVVDVEDIHEYGEKFIAFFLLFIPDIVGRMRFRRFWMSASPGSYTDLVDVTDESFGLLILENNRKKWTSEIRRKNGENVELTDSLYTRHAKKGGSGDNDLCIPARREGWSNEGIARFNTLCQHIVEIRSDKDKTTKLDIALKAKMNEMWNLDGLGDSEVNGRKSKRNRYDEDDEEVVVPYCGDVAFD